MSTERTYHVIPTPALWSVSVTSFVGTSPGAVHYYATIKDHMGACEYRVQNVITADMAVELDRLDEWRHRSMGLDPNEHKAVIGGWTERFDSRDDALAGAHAAWLHFKRCGDALVADKSYTFYPEQFIDGPDGFAEGARPFIEADDYKGYIDYLTGLGYWDTRTVFRSGPGLPEQQRREIAVIKTPTHWRYSPEPERFRDEVTELVTPPGFLP